jgi:hypothetical protein
MIFLMEPERLTQGGPLSEDNVYKLYLPLRLRIMLIVVFAFFVGLGIFMTIFPFVLGKSGPPAFFGIFWIAIAAWNAFRVLRIPHRIILHNDGSIEFISVLRKLKVHAMEVKSIKPEGGTFGFLVVEAKKKIRILAQFDGFHDFIAKLKTLNPSIVFRGC